MKKITFSKTEGNKWKKFAEDLGSLRGVYRNKEGETLKIIESQTEVTVFIE